MPIPASLVLEQAEKVHGLTVTPERAEELSQEVGRLNAVVAEAAAGLDFNDEPARFLSLLRRLGESEAPSGG
jgi:hypothetical protein